MTQVQGFISSLLAIIFFTTSAAAANLIEREGAYEINWSSGKIRFYGVGRLKDGEKNLRGAEQRAWADGIKLAEKNIPVVMSTRLGVPPKNGVSQLSKLAQTTTSVSTTYFGDQRIKVILESPISPVLPQLLGESDLTAPGGEPEGFILKVNGAMKPSAALRIIDEKGRDLAKVPVPRWVKGQVTPGDLGLPAESSVIRGTMVGQGVLKVSSAEWRSGYTAGLINGRAAVLVQ